MSKSVDAAAASRLQQDAEGAARRERERAAEAAAAAGAAPGHREPPAAASAASGASADSFQAHGVSNKFSGQPHGAAALPPGVPPAKQPPPADGLTVADLQREERRRA